MESHCIYCENRTDVRCFCNESLNYCYNHFNLIDPKYKEDHNFIDMQAATEYSFLVTKSLEIVQKSIILRSKSLIDVIKITTKVCLEKINNKAKVVKNFYKSNETGITQETFYESKKNFFNSFNLSKFIKDLNKSLSNFEDQEVNTDDKFTNVLRSFKVFDDNFEAESKNIDYEINLLKEK